MASGMFPPFARACRTPPFTPLIQVAVVLLDRSLVIPPFSPQIDLDPSFVLDRELLKTRHRSSL